MGCTRLTLALWGVVVALVAAGLAIGVAVVTGGAVAESQAAIKRKPGPGVELPRGAPQPRTPVLG